MSAFVSVRSLAWSFFSLRPHDQRRITDASVPPAPLALPPRPPPPTGAGALVVRARRVIGIARRMNARDALAAAHELDERGATRVGRRLVAGLVEEAAGRARQEDRVVLFQVLGGEHGRIPRRVGRPRARLLAQLLDRLRRQRNRRVLVARRWDAREDQHLVRLRRLGWRGRRQRRHHLLDVARARNGRLLAASAARIVQPRRRRAGDELRRAATATKAPAARRPAPPAPAAGAAGGPSAAFSAVESCSCVTEPDFWVSAASYHASNAVLSSAAVTDPSLSASKSVNSCGPTEETRLARRRQPPVPAPARLPAAPAPSSQSVRCR